MADEDEKWRYGVEEVDEDGVVEPEVEPIEPGSPKAENVAFFVLGVATMVGAIGLLLFG